MDLSENVTSLIVDEWGRFWWARECASGDGSWTLEERVNGTFEYRGILDLYTGAYFCDNEEPSYFETEPEDLKPEAMVRYVANAL